MTYRQCYKALIKKLTINENEMRLKYFEPNGIRKYLSEQERANYIDLENDSKILMKKIEKLTAIITRGKVLLSDEVDCNLLGIDCEKEQMNYTGS